MTSDKNFKMLRNTSLAAELSEEQCMLLAEHAVTRSLKDGEILIREGTINDQLHVVVSGNLTVTRETGNGDWVALHLLRPRDMAGELGFLDGQEHSATLRAVGPTEIVSLKWEFLEALLDTQPRLVYLVMRSIIREVHGILRRMNVQYVELSNYISKQHGRY